MNDSIGGHVRARRPGVFRAGRRAPLADAASVFHWLLAASELLRAGDSRLRFRLFQGGEQQQATPALYPSAKDGSIAGYLRRIGGDARNTGFVLNNFQAAHPDLWRLAQSLLARLQLSAASAVFDLFAGDYKEGFFGVHKDDQDVVTFVLEGKKRFLLWPYETFADDPAVAHGSELSVAFLRGVDPARYRDQAIVLEGEPGDILYWPAEYWHVAESDGGITATFALGLFVDSSPFRFVERAVCELGREGRSPGETAWPAGSSAGSDATSFLSRMQSDMRSALETDAVRARVEEKLIAHATSFGYLALPDPGPDDGGVDRDSHVRMPVPAALAWSRSEGAAGTELLWSVGGAVFRYPYVAAIVRLFERLAMGRALHVGRLLGDLEGDEITGEALLHVLDVIRRHHALMPADRS